MADEETTEAPKKAPANATAVFLKLSGYEKEDILASNERTRTFVTSNGGKYVLGKGGIRTLKGPDYPNFEPTEG